MAFSLFQFVPIASQPCTGKQYPASRGHIKPRPLLRQGYLFESLQGTMSQVTPVHGPQAASLGCLHQCLSYLTLHFHLLLIRKKKANIELPPYICFPFPSLLSCPVAWIIPVSGIISSHTHDLRLYTVSFSFTSCTLTSVPQSLTNWSR